MVKIYYNFWFCVQLIREELVEFSEGQKGTDEINAAQVFKKKTYSTLIF